MVSAMSEQIESVSTIKARINDVEVAKKLFAEIVPRYKDRPGGFTRTFKLIPRRGDGAPMAQIELVP